MSEQPSGTPGAGAATTGSRAVGKGRPTPKRSAAQKRRGPVPPPPTDRREAAKRLKAARAAERREVREGTLRGDPARMMARDAGPVRAFVRDTVDRRRSVGSLLMPVAVLIVVAQFVGGAFYGLALRLWTVTIVAALVDLVVTGVVVRREVRREFPDEKRMRGHIAYALMRTTVFRRLRTPPPRVRPSGLFGG